jgi:hypothetical protein
VSQKAILAVIAGTSKAQAKALHGRWLAKVAMRPCIRALRSQAVDERTTDVSSNPAPAAPTTAYQSQDQEKHNGSDEGVDDQSNHTCPEVNAKLRQQPVAYERTDETDQQVTDQSKTTALHYPACQIAGNNSDDDNHEKTLIGQVHDVASR